MIFNKKLITNKIELLEYQYDILELFRTSFNAELDKEIWKWAYIDNICGNPIVSLYFHNDKLIGHYAIIPMRLNFNSNNLLAALSMTTMVDINYRRHGIFIQQATEVYEKAKTLGFSLVYGFPNLKSAPGFKKRLDWTIDTQSYVIRIQGKYLINKKIKSENKICLDFQDKEFLKWRLSKPNQEYIKKDYFVLKKFDDAFDIVYHEFNFLDIEKENYYNLLVDESDGYQNEKEFEYLFGYKIFDDKLIGFEFKKDLIMSDVF